jgi:hypothetical protein
MLKWGILRSRGDTSREYGVVRNIGIRGITMNMVRDSGEAKD